MSRLKIGVMGCAAIARRSVLPAIKSLPEHFELRYVASRTAAKATAFASEFQCEGIAGYDSLLKQDIDAVYVPLPTGLHDEWINKALRAGKHVYAEKSIAFSASSAREMVDNARSSQVALMEGFMFLYHTQHQIVLDLIAKGSIGEIRSFRSSFGFPPLGSDNFRYQPALGGGVVFDAAGYLVRASHFFMGDDLDVVASSLFFDEKFQTHLFGTAYLKGDSGRNAQIAFGFDNFYQCSYELWGSKGKVTAERAFTPGPTLSPSILVETDAGREVIQAPKCNHFEQALLVFYSAARNPAEREKHYQDIVRQSQSLEKIIQLS